MSESGLRLQLLAGFALSDAGGVAVELSERKARALLAYLALKPDRHHERDALAALLWGDRGSTQARASLSKCLTGLRKAVGKGAQALFETDRDGVTLNSKAIEVDALRLRRLAESDDPEDLAEAAALYQGELLAGFTTPELAFEEWLRLERETTRKAVVELLSRLAKGRLGNADANSALAPAEQLVGLDPLNERAQRLLMQAYSRAGRRSAALEQYRVCEEQLNKELGVEPEEETKALLELIKTQGVGEQQLDDKASAAQDVGVEPGAHVSIPGKPSIAVLPFDNMSADPDQEFYADGIVEDVITALSHFRSLFVVARHSSFTYKGRNLGIARIARELGVRYVVEGSVRKVGDRVRITAQLIDATSGNHLWADRFDGGHDDVFDLQDRITDQIVAAIEPEIKTREGERARRKQPGSLDAWELVQRGLFHFDHTNKSDHIEAIRLFEAAIVLDPDFASAHAHLAYALFRSNRYGFGEGKKKSAASLRSAAERAISLDPDEALAHFALGLQHTSDGESDLAIEEMKAAIALNPNLAWGHYGLGFAYHTGAGQAEKALPHYDIALRLSPRDPSRWTMLMLKGSALRNLGRIEESVALCRQACRYSNTGFAPYLMLAASLAAAGKIGEARVATEKARQLEPLLSVTYAQKLFSGLHDSIAKSFYCNLRDAGLPD